jgi:hypothetical protein
MAKKTYEDKTTGHLGTIVQIPNSVKITCRKCKIIANNNTLNGAKSQFGKKHKEITTFP